MTQRVKTTLGIATAGPVEAAVLHGAICVAAAGAGQALEALVTCAQRVLTGAGITLDDVGLIAVCTGPGSFTGLRIGASFAKSLAQARDLPIVGVSSFDILEDGKDGRDHDAFPRVSVVEGKRGYYYARVLRAPGAVPEFIRGGAAELAAAGIERLAPELACGEQARRTAQLGLFQFQSGAGLNWRHIALDYGQRPNAVLNWESRRPLARRGRPSGPSKQHRR